MCPQKVTLTHLVQLSSKWGEQKLDEATTNTGMMEPYLNSIPRIDLRAFCGHSLARMNNFSMKSSQCCQQQKAFQWTSRFQACRLTSLPNYWANVNSFTKALIHLNSADMIDKLSYFVFEGKANWWEKMRKNVLSYLSFFSEHLFRASACSLSTGGNICITLWSPQWKSSVTNCCLDFLWFTLSPIHRFEVSLKDLSTDCAQVQLLVVNREDFYRNKHVPESSLSQEQLAIRDFSQQSRADCDHKSTEIKPGAVSVTTKTRSVQHKNPFHISKCEWIKQKANFCQKPFRFQNKTHCPDLFLFCSCCSAQARNFHRVRSNAFLKTITQVRTEERSVILSALHIAEIPQRQLRVAGHIVSTDRNFFYFRKSRGLFSSIVSFLFLFLFLFFFCFFLSEKGLSVEILWCW